ncbi:MAG: hypothetical protein VB104_07440 [Candidatus Limiplasma sp.]|nr:hypothetical protein [Candidatus Limiplasma sp.]
MIANSVNIMGTKWEIILRKRKDDPDLKGIWGYCDNTTKTIVIRKQHDTPQRNECSDLRELERSLLRHEIVHAFLFESGLASDSSGAEHWAKTEEIVDWIAQQHQKIHMAFIEAGAIEIE